MKKQREFFWAEEKAEKKNKRFMAMKNEDYTHLGLRLVFPRLFE